MPRVRTSHNGLLAAARVTRRAGATAGGGLAPAGRGVRRATIAVVVVGAAVGVGIVVGPVAVAIVVRVRVRGTATVVPGAIVVALAVGAGALVRVSLARHDDDWCRTGKSYIGAKRLKTLMTMKCEEEL
jgi:hypothetical protein